MALRINGSDGVREQFSSTGTTITLGGAASGFRTVASIPSIANGDTIIGAAKKGAEFVAGIFTYNSATGALTQTTRFWSTNGGEGGSAVSFSAGIGEFYCDAPSRLFDHLNFTEIAVASASTCDIGGAGVQGAKIEISGTTGITSFGTGTSKLRVVRFSGILTLTHNATTLILPGGANITTAAGDTAIFASDASGNWRCYSYTFGAVVPFDRRVPGAIGGSTPGSGAFTTISASGVLSANDTTEVGSGTGSIVTLGGLYVTKAAKINSSTASSSTTTGALVVGGGVGIAGAVFVGGTLNVRAGISYFGSGSFGGGAGITTGWASVDDVFYVDTNTSGANEAVYVMPIRTGSSHTFRGGIRFNGSAVDYNTSSDRDLKDDERPFLRAREVILGTEIWDHRWIGTNRRGVGVFAQDAYKVFPDAISPSDKKGGWAADYSKYVPVLIASNQELYREIDALKRHLRVA